MEKLTEAVINLINEDVVKGKKIIENELYVRLGKMLEEKLLDYAPGIFSEGSKPDFLDLDGDGNTKEPMKGAARSKKNKKNKKKMEESFSSEEDLITEDYEVLLEEVQQIVEEIEAETGEELSESEIEEIADLVLESYESDPDEDEDQDDDEDYDDEE